MSPVIWDLSRAVLAGALFVWFRQAGWVRIIGGRLFAAVTVGFSFLYVCFLVFFDIRPNNWNEGLLFPVGLAAAGLLLHKAGLLRYGRCILLALYLLSAASTLAIVFAFVVLAGYTLFGVHLDNI